MDQQKTTSGQKRRERMQGIVALFVALAMLAITWYTFHLVTEPPPPRRPPTAEERARLAREKEERDIERLHFEVRKARLGIRD